MGRNPTILLWLFFLLIFCFPSCFEKNSVAVTSFANLESLIPKQDRNSPILEKVYTATNIDSLSFGAFTKDIFYSLKQQRKLLDIQRRGKTVFNIDGLRFTKDDLKETVVLLEKWGNSAFVPLSEYFDVHQIAGKDKRGSVLFTGYYSPVLKVRSQLDMEYKYPIYARPKGMSNYPTRKQIYGEGALLDKGLELAYSNSLLDIQRMQLQGSGFVEYEDGSRYLFSYGGSNGHPRKSIQRYFEKNYTKKGMGVDMRAISNFISDNEDKADEIIYHNPSYVFFIKNAAGKKVNGSGNVPLVPFVSIATDKKYIPTGSCLMASRPVPRKGGIDYKMSILMAQDVGGGIKGPGHVDFYTGVGEKGRKAAFIRDYGELWLLLAKTKS